MPHFSMKTKSSHWQAVEKECRLSNSKFVAVQMYGRACYRSKQKDVACSDIFLLLLLNFYLSLLFFAYIFCGLCLCLQSETAGNPPFVFV